MAGEWVLKDKLASSEGANEVDQMVQHQKPNIKPLIGLQRHFGKFNNCVSRKKTPRVTSV